MTKYGIMHAYLKAFEVVFDAREALRVLNTVLLVTLAQLAVG